MDYPIVVRQRSGSLPAGAVLEIIDSSFSYFAPTVDFDSFFLKAYMRRDLTTLTLGEEVPDFELVDDAGGHFRLSESLLSGAVVLFFYPKDETAICTKEACGFRDEYETFLEAGAKVVGISRDSVDSHAAFRSNHSLPYPLLSDPGGRVAELFGVKKKMGVLPGRATFVIDRARKLRLNFHSALSARAHIDKARQVVVKLSTEE